MSLAQLLFINPNNFGQLFYTWIQMLNAHRESVPRKPREDFPLTELSALELFQAAESYLSTPSQVEVYCLCFSTV